MCVTSTSPARQRARVGEGRHAADGPAGARRARRPGRDQDGALRRSARPAPAADRRDRPRLQHPDVAARVEGPLGVLRRAVVLLDAAARARRASRTSSSVEDGSRGLLVAERRGCASRRPRSARRRAPCGGPRGRGSRARPCRRRSGRVTRVPETTLSPRPKAPSMTMRSRLPVAGSTVNMTPARVGGDLALDDDRDVHARAWEAALGAVEHRAAAEQRRPAAADGVDDRVGAARRSGRSRSCRRRTPSSVSSAVAEERTATGAVAVAARQRLVGGDDRGAQPRRHRAPLDELARGTGTGLERRRVVDVDAVEQLRDPLAQRRSPRSSARRPAPRRRSRGARARPRRSARRGWRPSRRRRRCRAWSARRRSGSPPAARWVWGSRSSSAGSSTRSRRVPSGRAARPRWWTTDSARQTLTRRASAPGDAAASALPDGAAATAKRAGPGSGATATAPPSEVRAPTACGGPNPNGATRATTRVPRRVEATAVQPSGAGAGMDAMPSGAMRDATTTPSGAPAG